MKNLAEMPGLATETKSFLLYLEHILPETKPAPEAKPCRLERLKTWCKSLLSETDERYKFAIDYSTKENYLQTLKSKYRITICNLESTLENAPDENVRREKIYELRMFVCGFRYTVNEVRKITEAVWKREIASSDYPEDALRYLEHHQQNNYTK